MNRLAAHHAAEFSQPRRSVPGPDAPAALDSDQRYRRPTGTCPARRIVCLWLPNWSIQRAQAVEPSLARQPFVLSTRDARRGLTVAAANLPARRAGVRPGMRLAEATGLAPVEIRQQDPEQDIEALCLLAEQAQRFSPLVGLEQLDQQLWAGRWLQQPECLLLDVTGLAHLFGGYANLLSQMGGWLHQQGYFGCLATGRTVGAAWALANYALRGQERPGHQEDQPPSKSSAGYDTTADQPEMPPVPTSRYLCVELEHEAERIAGLPLAALRLDDKTISALRRLGLSRLGQLAQLPRAGLANRLGDQLLLRWDQASGRRDEPILRLHGQPQWQVEEELELPVERLDTTSELLRRTVACLTRRLEQRGEGALRIVCRLDLTDHPPLVLQLGVFRPTCDPHHLGGLLLGQLERELSRGLPAPLWRLSVAATLTAPLVWRQADLFDSQRAIQRSELAQLVDSLSARLGRRHVLRARVQRESQPELAYQLQPLTGVKPDGLPQDTLRKLSSRQPLRVAVPTREDPLRRPLQLLESPLPIEVAGVLDLATLPVSTSAGRAVAPARVKTSSGWHQVVAACGPERLESGWWKGASCRRDYYRIVTHLGCWWWIYRDLNAGRWYLHGLFD